MLNDYAFLNDHSYSLRPVLDDNDEELSLKKREIKSHKRRRSSNRSRMILFFFRIFIDFNMLIDKSPSTSKRKVSIDRSSSDKENSSNSSNASVSVTKKNPSSSSRRSRLSTRIAMTSS